MHNIWQSLIVINNNNYDNLYGAVTRPYRYKGALQATLAASRNEEEQRRFLPVLV